MLTSRSEGGSSVTSSPPIRIVPAGRHLQAGDHAQRRRLAAAGGAEQRDEVPGLDGEGHGVDRDDVAVALGDGAQLDRRRIGVRSSCEALLRGRA